ncbi:MAG TPA: outer membrane beta-barrel protein [Xanthobacteraceae bacterium]|nr:outer membrane beta-barrel protein [Xanthobacteraceae bacterium]
MRWVIRAVAIVALASPALAQDVDILRGSQPVGPATFTRWSGFYLGGQVGFGDANANFSRATRPLVHYSLRDSTLESDDAVSTWPVLGTGGSDAVGYGGFVGYNTQWQDVVLGVEGNYTHTNFTTTAGNTPISRSVTAGSTPYIVNLTGTGQLQLTDYASLRARGGWVLGDFLPYGFAGLAIGRANYSVTSLVYGQENPSSPPTVPCNPIIAPTCIDFSYSNSNGQVGALMYGFAVGGGIDWTLAPNIFLRGEVEYVQFAPLANILVSVVSARAGAGFKF